MSPFISCPTCSCAVKANETTCPHCDARLRGANGRIAKTTVFAMLGLVGLGGCPTPAPKYGVPATDGDRTETPAPDASATTSASAAPPEPVPIYGTAGTNGD